MKNRTFRVSVVAAAVAVLSLGLSGLDRPAQAQGSTGSSEPDPAQFARGAQTWADNCNRCHNMRDPKEFRDDQWRSIVSHMRVRGGLTGGESRDVLAFLQGANNATVSPAPAPAAKAATAATFMPTAAAAETASSADGEAVYSQTCIACHGANGKGAIPGLPDFTGKDSPLSKSDAELLKNISEGFQSPGSFMAMPAKGGNPALTDDDVSAVLAYIRAEFGK